MLIYTMIYVINNNNKPLQCFMGVTKSLDGLQYLFYT